jgi:hypothetical protein
MDETQRIDVERHRRAVRHARPTWYAYAAIFASCLMLSISSLLISKKYADDSARKWCDIIVTMDDAYKQPRPPGTPPLTVTGQRIAKDMHNLRRELGCRK